MPTHFHTSEEIKENKVRAEGVVTLQSKIYPLLPMPNYSQVSRVGKYTILSHTRLFQISTFSIFDQLGAR